MRTKLILLMVFAASTLSAQNKLTIVIDGIENVKGHLMAGIYNEDSFLKKPPVAGKYEEIKANEITIVFEDIPSGEYSVSIFQDENNNQKLDTGAFGIPTEKYGFSNNAKGKMGPPSFDDCMFKIEEDTIIYITL